MQHTHLDISSEVEEEICQLVGTDREIATQKMVYDFAGNLYYVVEFSETGYLIYHADSGCVMEYSASAPSPYAAVEENLFYCGPTYYYVFDGNTYFHTIADESFDEADSEMLESAETNSNQLHTKCVEAANDSVYCIDTAAASGRQNDIAATASSAHYISKYSVLKNLKTEAQMGYYTNPRASDGGGCCGYIAAGMLLLWYDKGKGVNETINDFAYLNSNGSAFRGGDFTRYLRSLGQYDASDATGVLPGDESMRDIISKYARKKYCVTTTDATIIPSASKVCTWLRTYNAPVIVFGNFEKKGSGSYHAVLAYGWYDDNRIIANYGHEYYNEVTITAPLFSLGSILCVTDIRPYNPVINDIPSTNWAYKAAVYCKRYGIIDNGITNFNPSMKTTRGAFINAMYQLAAAPEISGSAAVERRFTDFNAATSYHDAIVWAYQNGILAGTSDTTIAPGNGVTREQAAVFLLRFSGYLTCFYASRGGPAASKFSDYSNVSSYARTAMDWATRRYLINGIDGALLPKNTLTRDQAAQLIYSFVNHAEH